MARIPEASADFDRAALIADLPMILESALDLILEDFEAKPGQTQSSAVGCRILAAVIVGYSQNGNITAAKTKTAALGGCFYWWVV